MILRRLGNKSKIAHKIIPYFPEHELYIELFMGACGMFFNKPKAKYNYLNDIDSNVYNCFDVLIRKKDELYSYLEMIPVHVDFWDECKTRTPDNNIEKAVYFLVLSNFGYMGKPDTLLIKQANSKKIILNKIEKTYNELVKGNNYFLNYDFRLVLNKISFDSFKKDKAFIYSDPPYLYCTHNYDMPEWTEEDVIDCFDVTFNSGIKAAMSEFDNEFILQQAKERNLNVHIIGERQNMKNRRTEILITNYQTNKTLFG